MHVSKAVSKLCVIWITCVQELLGTVTLRLPIFRCKSSASDFFAHGSRTQADRCLHSIGHLSAGIVKNNTGVIGVDASLAGGLTSEKLRRSRQRYGQS